MTGKDAEAAAEAKKKTLLTAAQEVDANEGKLPTIAWTTFPSWEAVGAWYRGLEGDRMVPSSEVKAKVAEITAGKTTEEERVRAVYGYVATQNRYIGVALGVGRYQPHRAEEVLENQYGDCKDKHTLLAAMLAALGLKAEAVLIGAGVRFNPDVPSPAAFNHLITRVQVGGQPVWLDATTEVAPYRVLLPVIRDHMALAVPDTGTAHLERTPADLPFKPFQKFEASGSLDKNGLSNSKVTLTLRGDVEVGIRAVLRQVPPAQYDQLVQNISQGLNFGGTTSHAEISRAEDTAEPLVIRYDYKREKAGDWDNYKTLAQLAPVALPVFEEKEPPVRTIDLGAPRVETSVAEMRLPEGWGAELPEAVHARSKYATWDQTYRIDKGVLYAERRVEILVQKVPVAEWKDYKKWTDVTTPGSEQYVQLTRATCAACGVVSGTVKEKGPPVATASNAKAAGLVKSAYDAVGRHELEAAVKMLDEAKANSPQQAYLWSTYGYAAFQRGAMREAIEDYEKELSLHPDNVGVYQSLVEANYMLKQTVEATAAMRRWSVADPDNPGPKAMLIHALLEGGDATAALREAEEDVKKLPEDKRQDERIQFELGRAQIRSGEKAKGGSTLAAVLKTAQSPTMLNYGAYELAEAEESLDVAETSARAALAKLDAQSDTWTMDENAQMLMATNTLIVATWDTMGWVLYREGKLKEAEAYLRPAFLNGQREAIGEHLGDVLAAEGDKEGAAKAYAMTLATAAPAPMATEPGAAKPMPSTLRIKGKMNAVGAKNGVVAGFDGAKMLQKARTISLGPSGARSGAAEYKLLLSAKGVLQAKPTGEKTLPDADALFKKASVSEYFPAESGAHLVRPGILNCHAGTCEIVLEP